MPDTTTADTPTYAAIERTTMTARDSYPVEATRPAPVDDALAFTADRLDRIDHALGSLQATIQRLGLRLTPVLTDGTYGSADRPLDANTDPTPEDRRSTIAKRISSLGVHADATADLVARLERDLTDLTDALEV